MDYCAFLEPIIKDDVLINSLESIQMTALRVIFGIHWEDKITNKAILAKSGLTSIKERMSTLLNRYITNAIYTKNELILGLIEDSIVERRKSLINTELADEIILSERAIRETNEYMLTRPWKHKSILCDFLTRYFIYNGEGSGT